MEPTRGGDRKNATIGSSFFRGFSETTFSLNLLEKVALDFFNSLLEEGRHNAFFILDIDNFKSVNDTFGHAFGDQVIMIFAASIRDVEWAHKKAEQLVEILNREVLIDKVGCQVSASIGVSICPDDRRNFETQYKNADTALYVTKNRGKNGYSFYEGQMEPPMVL